MGVIANIKGEDGGGGGGGGSVSSVFHANALASGSFIGNQLAPVRSVLIPAGTLSIGDILRISCSYIKPVYGAFSAQMRWYLNSTNQLSGATQIFYNAATAANRGFIGLQWRFALTDTTKLKTLVTGGYWNDFNQATSRSTELTIPDISADMYLIFAVLPGQAGISEVFVENTLIEILRTAT